MSISISPYIICDLSHKWLVCVFSSEDANKAFSTAVQVYDTSVKAWVLWCGYLENRFTRES
jgi:transformation/transcription domain-associated protein